MDDVESARQVVAELCAGQSVVADGDAVLAPVIEGLELVQDPWTADVGVTTGVAAAAATSRLALAFDAAHPRRTALVPPVHVAVVPTDRLVATYPPLTPRPSPRSGRCGRR